MIIGIDGNEANVERRVGIGEYSFELLKKFEEFLISNFKFQIYLKNSPLAHMPKEREGWEYRVIGPKKLWTQLALPIDLSFHRKVDVFFTPSHYAPRFCPVPSAISVMDLSYLYFPDFFRRSDLYQLTRWTAYSIRNASRIFTISKASKNDIIKEYNVASDNVIVTYPGIRKIANSKLGMDELRKKYQIGEKYILFVGTLQPRKNIVRLIEAFSKIKDKNGIDLLIVGKKGWHYEEILASPKKFGVEDTVRFLDFVDEGDLGALYSNALFFVLPSLYEGFGLPILEAMQYGCPVIASNVSSMPEVGGDAALYIDPMDTEDITLKMEELIQSREGREILRKKGYTQVKKFSWEKTARETLAQLEKMGNYNAR